MTMRSTVLRTLSAAAFLAACGGSPPAAAPAPQPVQAAPVQPAPAAQAPAAALSDERAMELARGYVELLHAGDYDRLWQHVAPAVRERFGTVDQFRGEGVRAMGELGAEITVVSEQVEVARAGMVADKLYLRVSHYAGAPEGPVRLMLGLKNDGSIAGLQVRRPE